MANPQNEAWKYTPVYKLADADFATAANSELPTAEAINGLNSIELVFTDGVLQSDLSQLPAGLTIASLADASSETRQWAAKAFTAVKPSKHIFGLVNDVLATAGVIIDVAEGVSIEPVIRIVHVLAKVMRRITAFWFALLKRHHLPLLKTSPVQKKVLIPVLQNIRWPNQPNLSIIVLPCKPVRQWC